MRKLVGVLWVWLLMMPAGVLAAGGGGGDIVIVADSRQFTGLAAWWTNLYNESHLYFAIVTIVTIPLLGFLLGSITAFFMRRLGINLKTRVLAEH